MPYVADESLLGILPLKNHEFEREGLPLDYRHVIYACRVENRDVGPQKHGHHRIADGTVGDVINWYHWQTAGEDKRPIGAWSACWPVVVTGQGGERQPITDSPNGSIGIQSTVPVGASGGGNAGIQGSNNNPGAQDDADFELLPIFDEKYEADPRFQKVRAQVAGDCPQRFPGGTVGLLLDGTDETRQTPLFFPTDRALVAVNAAGDPDLASYVYDLTADDKLDCDRRARLHSTFRVVRPRPPGKYNWTPDLNSICWQVGLAGQDGLEGLGLICDSQGPGLKPLQSRDNDNRDIDETGASVTVVQPPPTPTVIPAPGIIAATGLKGGGIWDVGSPADCPHRLGTTLDGEPIFSAHIATTSLHRGQAGDGPLDFEPVRYSTPPRMPFRSPVHLRFDPEREYDWLGDPLKGVWRWEAEVPVWIPTTGEPPIIETPPPIIETPKQVTTPRFRPRDKSEPKDLYSVSTLPMASTGGLVKPGDNTPDLPDLRRIRNPSEEDVEVWLSEAPTVARVEGFTRRYSSRRPVYTRRPGAVETRYRGGTASGGQAFMIPELDIADFLAKGNGAVNDTMSTSCFVFTPRTRLGFGLPDSDTGCTKSGWVIYEDDDDLNIEPTPDNPDGKINITGVIEPDAGESQGFLKLCVNGTTYLVELLAELMVGPQTIDSMDASAALYSFPTPPTTGNAVLVDDSVDFQEGTASLSLTVDGTYDKISDPTLLIERTLPGPVDGTGTTNLRVWLKGNAFDQVNVQLEDGSGNLATQLVVFLVAGWQELNAPWVESPPASFDESDIRIVRFLWLPFAAGAQSFKMDALRIE